MLADVYLPAFFPGRSFGGFQTPTVRRIGTKPNTFGCNRPSRHVWDTRLNLRTGGEENRGTGRGSDV